MSKASICEYFVCQSHWNFSTMLQFFSIPMPMRLSVGTWYSVVSTHSCCITAALYALQSVTCVLMYSSGNLNLIWALRARYSNCFNSLFDEAWTEVGYSSVGINFQADCCWIFIAAEPETWARFLIRLSTSSLPKVWEDFHIISSSLPLWIFGKRNPSSFSE